MMPQFHKASCRFDKENVAVGLTLLSFGLFKKVILADNIATIVTPIFDQATAGNTISFLLAWAAAIGFTLQIYFDFSGYTDMALGLARFFGIRLPQNFNSPLKAASIIEFWLRWHMTLTRFLTAYIFNPLTLWLTRRRMAKGQSGLAGRNTTIGAFAYLLMFPTVLTMFVSGLWHGAGYGFIVWGLLHGLYLTINHAWRLTWPRFWSDRAKYERLMRPLGHVLTFVAVSVSMVFFRAPTITAAIDIVKGTVGYNGVALPQAIYDHVGPLTGLLHNIGVTAVSSDLWTIRDFATMVIWIITSMLIALLPPNTLEMLDRYEPALGVKPHKTGFVISEYVKWSPSLSWGIAVSVATVLAVLSLGGPSEFLYWQF
jgi:alginate O-acetyltransferase complex protein AlgI